MRKTRPSGLEVGRGTARLPPFSQQSLRDEISRHVAERLGKITPSWKNLLNSPADFADSLARGRADRPDRASLGKFSICAAVRSLGGNWSGFCRRRCRIGGTPPRWHPKRQARTWEGHPGKLRRRAKPRQPKNWGSRNGL